MLSMFQANIKTKSINIYPRWSSSFQSFEPKFAAVDKVKIENCVLVACGGGIACDWLYCVTLTLEL